MSQVVHLGARKSKEVKVEIVQPAAKDTHIGLGVIVPEVRLSVPEVSPRSDSPSGKVSQIVR